MRHLLSPIVALVAAIVAGSCNEGCKPASSPSDLEKAYIMELLACTEQPTKEASVACRKAVNTKYGLCEPGDWPRISPCD